MAKAGFMSIELLLVEHLRQRVLVPGLKILTSADLEGVKESAQHVPAVHVIYAGPTIREEKGLVEIVETWVTGVAVRNLRTTRGGQDARLEAGPILDEVFETLLGWQSEGIKPLLPITPPKPYFNAGFGYFPLVWQVRLKKIPMPCIN